MVCTTFLGEVPIGQSLVCEKMPQAGQNVERTLRSPYSLVDEPAITAPEFLLERAEFHVQNGKGEQTWLVCLFSDADESTIEMPVTHIF